VAVIQQRNHVDAFAVTAPGLEAICAGELADLGLRGRVEDGGVAWRAPLDSIARANLWLRTASRVLVRVAGFRATAFYELELAARRVGWDRFVTPMSTVRFRVTCRKSKLYHSSAVAQRLADAVTRRVPGARVEIANPSLDGDDETRAGEKNERAPDVEAQLFVVRLLHDVCTISADTSGALLHRRGYRQQLAKAPLRETIAAAMLVGAGWPGDAPLIDPMCGSGTIALEAARMARRIAPGRDRAFAFHAWPEFDRAKWRTLLDEARACELARVPATIAASDRDRGAIDAALANAMTAGVENDIAFDVAPISALRAPSGRGWLVSNPPYGVRVGERDRLRNLYAQLGNIARARLGGWTVALLIADRRLQGQMRLAMRERFATKNGGIPVRLVVGSVPEK